MKLRVFIALVVAAAVALAVAGWAVQGIRWVAAGGSSRRPRLATA